MSRTVKVTNLSLRATKRDVEDFFSFSGEIERVDLQKDTEHSQVAHVTFKDPLALDTALLLSGATIVDQAVTITAVEDSSITPPPPYVEMPAALEVAPTAAPGSSGSAMNRAQDVVTSMLAKGFILGKDAMNKAKGFDEKHGFSSNAAARVSSFDKKIGFSEKITSGTAAVNEKVKSMDEKYQVSEKTKSAIAAAEQKVNSAGSALMKNRYILQGASWVTGAFNRVAKAAEDVGMKTKEKVTVAEGSKGVSHNDDLSHDDNPTNYVSLGQHDSSSGFSSQHQNPTGSN